MSADELFLNKNVFALDIFTQINPMRKISEFNSRKEWEDFIWSKFLESAERAKDDRKLKIFLDGLLSTSEKRLIVKRLAALNLIKAGKTYKEIGEILWISPNTLSALKKSILNQSAYLSARHYYKIAKNKKEGKIKGLPPQTIFDYWLNLPMPTKTGKGRWKFLNYQR